MTFYCQLHVNYDIMNVLIGVWRWEIHVIELSKLNLNPIFKFGFLIIFETSIMAKKPAELLVLLWTGAQVPKGPRRPLWSYPAGEDRHETLRDLAHEACGPWGVDVV